jgi:hypothetical protein
LGNHCCNAQTIGQSLVFVIPGRTVRCEPGIHFSSRAGGAMDSGLDAVASPRNDEVGRYRQASAFSQHDLPELCMIIVRAPNRGRRESRVPQCTRSLACENKKHASIVTTGSPEIPGLPCANGFNGFLRALPGDRAFLSPSSAEISSVDLMPASRHQDHTTSPSASMRVVFTQRSVHRIPHPTFVTIAKRPS